MKYEIRYLPLASKDLYNIVSYIADELKAPKAAMDLLNALDESISRLESLIRQSISANQRVGKRI